MPNPADSEKLAFWCPRTLADSVRRKLLDHKIATRERITITDICTKALQDYLTNNETAQAVLEQAVKNYLTPKGGNGNG
jgi:hypothetical protein